MAPGDIHREPSDSFGYALKRLVLGKPLVTDELKSERLSNPVALGVLAPDAISSTAYGTEMILLELLPFAALAALRCCFRSPGSSRASSYSSRPPIARW